MSVDRLEYQKEVLKLLCTNTVFAVNYGSLIKADYFDNNILKILFSIVSNYVMQYNQVIDKSHLFIEIASTVQQKGYSEEIEKSLQTEAKEIFNKYISSEQYIIDKFVDFARYQEVKNAIIKSVDILENSKSYERVLKLIDEAVGVGTGINDGLTFNDVSIIQSKLREKYDPRKLVKTGFSTFDKCLMGGMAPGEVHVIMGSPKVGKSTTACNIGVNALMYGSTVFHISLEIKAIDVLYKYAVRMARCSYQDLMSMNDNEYKKRIEVFKKYQPKLFVNYWTEKTINTLTIRSWIYRKRAELGVNPDLIVIDYDDCLLPVSGRKDDMYNEAADIYSDLIGLADTFQAVVLTFAQPIRASWSKINNNELIVSDELAHSARKAHRASSISSINFKQGSNKGSLYIDRVRRGIDGIEIPMERDLSRALIKESASSFTITKLPEPKQDSII